MRIKIIANSSMKNEEVKVPTTLAQAIKLSGLSRTKIEQLIIENEELPVQNGDYYFILVRV